MFPPEAEEVEKPKSDFIWCHMEEQRIPISRCASCSDKDLCPLRDWYMEQIDSYVGELGIAAVNRVIGAKFNVKYANKALPVQWKPIVTSLKSELDQKNAARG